MSFQKRLAVSSGRLQSVALGPETGNEILELEFREMDKMWRRACSGRGRLQGCAGFPSVPALVNMSTGWKTVIHVRRRW